MNTPSAIKLHRKSKTLELQYSDGTQYHLSCEYLRVMSPSAEVKGHGPGQETLQHGKKDVAITGITSVGNYAIQPTFDDGHDSGIYSWTYLKDLAENFESHWQAYLDDLAQAGKTRDPDVQVVKIFGG